MSLQLFVELDELYSGEDHHYEWKEKARWVWLHHYLYSLRPVRRTVTSPVKYYLSVGVKGVTVWVRWVYPCEILRAFIHTVQSFEIDPSWQHLLFILFGIFDSVDLLGALDLLHVFVLLSIIDLNS